MRISRVFRKYSRVLLLVFMSLLLVVFLLGDVISRAQRSYTARDREVGRAFGKPVFLSQTQAAERDFELAAQLRMPTPQISTGDPWERNLATHLLLEEARRAGVRIGRDQIIEAFRGAPGASEVLAAIRRRSGRSLNSIYDSVARVAATMVLAQHQFAAAGGASLPELEQIYRDENQQARVLLSVIDSRAFQPRVPEPTEDELQAHFEIAKDRVTKHTDKELVYGYRIPDRVQIEYLTVDPAEIEARVRVSEKQARRYYEDNRYKYVKTVESASPFEIDKGEPQKIQMTYEEVKDRVREDCRAAKAITEAQRLANRIRDEARRPWDAAPLDENNVRGTPPADALVSFTELQRKFSADYPVVYRKTGLLTERDLLTSERGFARSGVTVRGETVSAPTLAFRVEGLADVETDDDVEILRINEPGPLVVERRGGTPGEAPEPYQGYVFRVIAVEPSGPPASLDDVREAVVENVKQLKAFELAGAQARGLAESARQVGLEQATAEAKELRGLLGETEAPPTTEPASGPRPADRYVRMLQPFEPESFLRRPAPIQKVGYSPALHDAAFALADESDPAATEGHRVVVVPLPGNRRWAVAELLEVEPIYRGDFEQRRAELEQKSRWAQFQQFWDAWFSPENIFQRTGYVPASTPEQ